jgi:D-alanine-D-alanine ligase
MKVLILLSDMPGLDTAAHAEAEVANDIFITADAVQQGLASRGHVVERALIRKNMLDVLLPYDPREWLVFNLCETLEGEAYREAYVPAVLDVMGYTYTGSNTRTLYHALNKARTKQTLVAHGLPTAPFQVFHSPAEPLRVPFPVFVKPVAEDASYGVNHRSVASNVTELREQVKFVIDDTEQPALVEEFLGGREFNVALWGNSPTQVLPLAEIDYSAIPDPFQQIISFATKWDQSDFTYHHTPVTCPAVVDESLAERIRHAAREAYRVMGCRDYARVDMRVRGDEPFILEVNPNCGLAPAAGFSREANAAGYDYAAMAEQIVLFASERMKVNGEQ